MVRKAPGQIERQKAAKQEAWKAAPMVALLDKTWQMGAWVERAEL